MGLDKQRRHRPHESGEAAPVLRRRTAIQQPKEENGTAYQGPGALGMFCGVVPTPATFKETPSWFGSGTTSTTKACGTSATPETVTVIPGEALTSGVKYTVPEAMETPKLPGRLEVAAKDVPVGQGPTTDVLTLIHWIGKPQTLSL